MSTSSRTSRPVCTFSSTASLSANQRPFAEPEDSTVISSTMRSATSKSPAMRRSSAASNSDGSTSVR